MEVFFEDHQQDLAISSLSVEATVSAVVSFEGKCYDSVSVVFVSEEESATLHLQHFDDPSPTDCMSFPMDFEETVGHRVLGDVIVCPKVACDYVAEHGGDSYEETTLYLIHGLLHLMGYDDIDERDRVKMRAAERRHLEHLQNQQLLLYQS